MPASVDEKRTLGDLCADGQITGLLKFNINTNNGIVCGMDSADSERDPASAPANAVTSYLRTIKDEFLEQPSDH
jgi:hypothetical protein